MKSFTIDHSKTCTWLNRFITYFSNYFFELSVGTRWRCHQSFAPFNLRINREYATHSLTHSILIPQNVLYSICNHFVCYYNILSFDFNSHHHQCVSFESKCKRFFIQFKRTGTMDEMVWSAHHWKWWDFILTFQESSKSRNASSKPP